MRLATLRADEPEPDFFPEMPVGFGDEEDTYVPVTLPRLHGAELAEYLPPLSYLVEGLAMVDGGGAPHLFAGYGYSGKTLAAQSMLLSLAAGRAVWGVHTCQPRRVAHVDLEQGDRLTRRRYQRLAFGLGIDLTTDVGENIAVFVMPPALQFKSGCIPQWEDIMGDRALVLVDSLRVASGGIDENSSQIREGLDMLNQLGNKNGCRSLVICHARKPPLIPSGASAAFDIRGSGAIFDACDCVYQLGSSDGGPIEAQQTKARSHGEPISEWALVISDVPSEDGHDPRAGVKVQVHGTEIVDERRAVKESRKRAKETSANAERLMTVISAKPGLGTRELRAITRLSGDKFTAAILHLGSKVESATNVLLARADRSRRGITLMVDKWTRTMVDSLYHLMGHVVDWTIYSPPSFPHVVGVRRMKQGKEDNLSTMTTETCRQKDDMRIFHVTLKGLAIEDISLPAPRVILSVTAHRGSIRVWIMADAAATKALVHRFYVMKDVCVGYDPRSRHNRFLGSIFRGNVAHHVFVGPPPDATWTFRRHWSTMKTSKTANAKQLEALKDHPLLDEETKATHG